MAVLKFVTSPPPQSPPLSTHTRARDLLCIATQRFSLAFLLTDLLDDLLQDTNLADHRRSLGRYNLLADSGYGTCYVFILYSLNDVMLAFQFLVSSWRRLFLNKLSYQTGLENFRLLWNL
jgi:hypothetical protein